MRGPGVPTETEAGCLQLGDGGRQDPSERTGSQLCISGEALLSVLLLLPSMGSISKWWWVSFSLYPHISPQLSPAVNNSREQGEPFLSLSCPNIAPQSRELRHLLGQPVGQSGLLAKEWTTAWIDSNPSFPEP